jgi:hypothetical protein
MILGSETQQMPIDDCANGNNITVVFVAWQQSKIIPQVSFASQHDAYPVLFPYDFQ